MKRKLYQQIASAIEARENCHKTGNAHWADNWDALLRRIAGHVLPSGGGFDNGTFIDSASRPDCIVIQTAFHHMDEHGYCGWTEHTVRVKPSLAHGFTLTISGRNRNGIKDYIADCFDSILHGDEITPPWVDGKDDRP